MPIMGKHSPAEAANTRARVSAWAVFISMAATTMSFQVYHSIEHGKMPWPLAGLYGIIPLLISMLLIEFVSGWDDAPAWIRPAAYLIIGGAMYLSAAATGDVVLHAAPLHSSLLFGLLLDGAAILAARFLMTTAKVTAAMAQAAFAAAMETERSARQDAEAERDAARQDADEAARAAAGAAAQAEEAVAKAADLARQLADTKAGTGTGTKGDATGQRGSGSAGRHKGDTAARPRTKDPAAQAAEAVTYAEAALILADEPGISGSELGRKLGTTPGYGRTLKRKLTQVGQGGGE
jgi:hypothetical protein